MYSCLLSGLPIPPGTPVRYLLLVLSTKRRDCGDVQSKWTPRALPLRGKAGEFQMVDPLDISPQDWETIQQGFQQDLVEVGVGDNTVHDVPVRKGMSFSSLEEAIREDRVRVTVAGPTTSTLPDPAAHLRPTLHNIEQILQRAGIADVWLVDEVDGGCRVRPKTWHVSREVHLPPLKVALTGFTLAVVAGVDSGWEVRCFMSPGHSYGDHGTVGHRWHTPRQGVTTVPVQAALIREDIWQKVCQMSKFTKYGEESFSNLSLSKENVRTALQEAGTEGWYMRWQDHAGAWILAEWRSTPNTVSHHVLRCVVDDRLVADVAEFAHVVMAMQGLGIYFRPSELVGGMAPTQRYVEFHNACADVMTKYASDKKD